MTKVKHHPLHEGAEYSSLELDPHLVDRDSPKLWGPEGVSMGNLAVVIQVFPDQAEVKAILIVKEGHFLQVTTFLLGGNTKIRFENRDFGPSFYNAKIYIFFSDKTFEHLIQQQPTSDIYDQFF